MKVQYAKNKNLPSKKILVSCVFLCIKSSSPRHLVSYTHGRYQEGLELIVEHSDSKILGFED